MSGMRHKTLRRRVNSRLRESTTDEEKVRIMRTLYIMVYNNEDSIIPLTTELFHVLGEILEGAIPEELDLHRIDKEKFLRELEEMS